MSKSRTYTIIINDHQRQELLYLLKDVNTDMPSPSGISDGFMMHPLQYWKRMLEQLPKEEDDPKMIHGFCL